MADRSALSDRAYGLLKTRIIDLELGPGDRLNVDRLAVELDVSPTPVREALNRLAAEGIVTAAPYRGFRVSPLLSLEDLIQLLWARRVIETAAVGQAASGSSGATLQELAALVARMKELTQESTLNAKVFNATDAAFHRLTIAASGNRFMLRAFDSLHVHVQIARHYQGNAIKEAQLANDEHRRLLAAFASGDAAAAAMEAGAHVAGVLTRLQADLDAQADAAVNGESR